MQPEQSDFLTGIRRELLALVDPSSRIGESMRGITLTRAAEALAHLAIREEALPKILAEMRPRLLALLRNVIALLEGRGTTAPAAMLDAAALSDAPTEG